MEISGKSVEKKWKSVTDFLFLALKSLRMVTAAIVIGCLLLGMKVITNIDSISKVETSLC